MVERKVLKYIDLIKNSDEIGRVLSRLEHLPMTLEVLSNTGIGKIVNRLKNDVNYGRRATRIVEKWRELAANTCEVKKPEESGDENSSDSEANSDACEASLSDLDSQKKSSKNEETMKIENSTKTAAFSSVSKPKKVIKRHCTEEPEDAFAAALSAVDKIKTDAKKPAKKQRDSSFFSEIERSLANSVRDASYNPANRASSSVNAPPINNNSDIGIVKAKMGSHKVYAGRRKVLSSDGVVPRLFDICIRICIKNIDAIEETGDIPFDVLKPVLEKCTNFQLAKIESKNPYLEEDTDYLWEKHCSDVFPNEQYEGETWKQCFFSLTHKREERLRDLSTKIARKSLEAAQPQRRAILADPIAPRDARRRQVKHGTIIHSSAVPNAADLSRSRRQIFESGSANALSKVHPVVRNVGRYNEKRSDSANVSHISSSSNTPELAKNGSGSKSAMNAIFAVRKTAPKKGALMVKSLKMMKAKRN